MFRIIGYFLGYIVRTFQEGYNQAMLVKAKQTVDQMLIVKLGGANNTDCRTKVDAIKQCRQLTGLGLKEAKDHVESLMTQNNINYQSRL